MKTSTAAARSPGSALCALAATLLGTLAAAAAAAAATAITTATAIAAPSGSAWAESLTRQALASGYLTRLPPTVSVALGLDKAKEGTDVRQLITKSGHRVRTFNVSVARNSDLVLFTVDARTGATAAYLIGPDGRLRKAVSYQAGQQAEDMPAAEARTGLAREARFWSARAKHAAAPAGQ